MILKNFVMIRPVLTIRRHTAEHGVFSIPDALLTKKIMLLPISVAERLPLLILDQEVPSSIPGWTNGKFWQHSALNGGG